MMRICIIGCANLGKSTLFNALVGRKTAITHDTPGVTVDCREQKTTWDEQHIAVIDTPGFDECLLGKNVQMEQINRQIRNAIMRSDVVLHVIDANTGTNHFDVTWSQFCLSRNKAQIVVANKIDITGIIDPSCYQLSGSELVPISAKYRDHLQKLKQAILQKERLSPNELPAEERFETIESNIEQRPLEVCLIGKPNAGKSTLINRLCHRSVAVVSAQAGTTTDANQYTFKHKGQNISIYDTAGLRRKGRVLNTIEKYSAHQCIQTMQSRHTDIAIVVIDATEGVSDQDYRILELIEKARKQCVMLINKWDKLNSEQKALYRKHMSGLTNHRAYIPVFFASAEKDRHFNKLLNTLTKLPEHRNIPPTSYLTKLIEHLTSTHRPPLIQNKEVKIRLAFPNEKRMASMTIQGKRVSKIPKSYMRYLQNQCQTRLNIEGISLEIIAQDDHNPYD